MTDSAKLQTILTHAGRAPFDHKGIVNPPVYHASTVLYPDVATMRETEKSLLGNVRYGRMGTPTSYAFEDAVAKVEGAHGGVSLPSGLAAVTTALLAFLKTGDHLLMVDTAYKPTRMFCDNVLNRMGVHIEYYDPMIGADIRTLIRDKTTVIFMESPGSLTFEVQDVPAIAKVAKDHGIVSMIDNTWGTPLFFRPLDFGVDISIHAATKYIVGHSDAMLGICLCNEQTLLPLKKMAVALGSAAGPDDLYLGQRGLRSLDARLRVHWPAGLAVADWLSGRSEVIKIRHPARPDDDHHALWARDFSGACGLFAFELDPKFSQAALDAMLDRMRLFRLGYSWGGYESLVIPADPGSFRTAVPWKNKGHLIRLHVGLEDVDDLIMDLEQSFSALHG